MANIEYEHLSSLKESGRAAVAPGAELSYIDQGAGQPIVFIPGWTFSKNIFEKQVEPLSKKYRVITYDPRSQGASSHSPDGNDYLSHAEDLVKLLDTLKVKNPVLVGWAAGCHTSLGYIKLKGAHTVAAHISIDAPPRSMSFERDAWVEASLEEVSAVHTLYLRDVRGQAQYLRDYVETILIQRNLEFHELSWIMAQALKTPPLVAAQLFASAMFSDNLASAIAVSRVKPTLYVIAQHWAEKAQRYLRTILPEAKTMVFGGRMMFWEYPEAFNRVLDDFIQNNIKDTGVTNEDISHNRFGNHGFHDAGVQSLERRVANRFI
ncbi:MAG: alpha/beta hydrolase [Acidocella sp.]|nr:alpha/beta hydrolase [Acidocella sp.]